MDVDNSEILHENSEILHENCEVQHENCEILQEKVKSATNDEEIIENIEVAESLDAKINVEATESNDTTDNIEVEATECMETNDEPKMPKIGERRQDLYSSERFKLELSNLGKFSYGVSIYLCVQISNRPIQFSLI